MITGVKLKNWRSHLNSELSFTNGTNALLGHMGSGKTTILDSICFALFGTFPSLQSRKLKIDDLIMDKPSIKDMSEVEVSFQMNGKNYSIKRIIEKRKGTTYSEIRENGKLLEAPSTQRVNELSEKIFKIDYELFSKAIYSEQNALDYFLTIPKGQRMRKIDELLMIDKFEKARSNTITLVNRISERKLAKQDVVDKVDVHELETTIKNLKNSLENLLGEKTQFEKEISEIEGEKAGKEEELEKLRKARENFETLRRDEKGISSAIQEISNTLENLEKTLVNVDKDSLRESFSSSSKLLEELTNSLDERRSEQEKILSQYSKSKAEAEVQKNEIDKLKSEVEKRLKNQKEAEKLKKRIGENSDKEFDKRKRLIEEYVGRLEAIRIKVTDLSEIVDQLSSIKAKCPICESKLSEEKKIILIKQKKSQIENLKEEFQRSARQKKITEEDLRDLELSVEKLNELLLSIKDLDDLKSNLENTQNIFNVLIENTVKYEKETKAIKNTIDSVQNKISETQNAKQRFEILMQYMRDYETSKSRIQELSGERNRVMMHLQEIEKSFTDEDMHKLENELRNLTGREKELSAKISSLESLVSEREIRMKELEDTFSTAVKEKEDVKKLDSIILQLKLFEKSLEATQIQLRQEFITTVNYSMNQLWSTLYPYQDYPEIRLNVEEGDYVLQLKSRNEWVNVEGIASGGERNIAVLALRIAFSLILAPHLRLLILDEPTANMDSTAVRVLSDALRERIGEFIDQTFLITHQSELEDAVTGNAYKLERDKANDGYTQVVQLN